MELSGLAAYAVFFSVIAGIYALLSLGLHLQWGRTGLFNVGVSGFFAVGAYASALLTTPPAAQHVGGFGMPFAAGLAGATLLAGVLGLVVGVPTLRLKEDYLAIATIGIAETIRQVFANEPRLAGGVQGLRDIPRPLRGAGAAADNLAFLAIVILAIAAAWWCLARAGRSPWGRVLTAIREDEVVASALGKDVVRFKMEAMVVGSAIMGAAGSLYAHFIGFVSPDAFEPLAFTFLVWVMLTVGGSARPSGAVAGAFLIWGVWTGAEFAVSHLPATVQTKAGALRVILVALVLEAILLLRPEGLVREKKGTDLFS